MKRKYTTAARKDILLRAILTQFKRDWPGENSISFQYVLKQLRDKYNINTRTIGNFFKDELKSYGTFGGNRKKFIRIPEDMENTPRLTADKARQLAGRSFDEKIDAILVAIEETAKNRGRSLRTGWEYKEDQDLWINGGYSKTHEWKQAEKVLTDLGFTVSFYYNELQFVDMYTLIKW